MINFHSDKKYIINLKKRTDRKQEILSQLGQLGIINWEFFDAIDGETVFYDGKLKRGQIGCLYSHLEIIKKAKALKLPHVIIMEDDAIFDGRFNTNSGIVFSQIPADWQMFYFGAHNYRSLEMVSANIGKCVTSLSTICYAVKEDIYDLLIEQLSKVDILDIVYVNKIHPVVKAYCVFPNLVRQKTGFSDIEKTMVNYDYYYKKWE